MVYNLGLLVAKLAKFNNTKYAVKKRVFAAFVLWNPSTSLRPVEKSQGINIHYPDASTTNLVAPAGNIHTQSQQPRYALRLVLKSIADLDFGDKRNMSLIWANCITESITESKGQFHLKLLNFHQENFRGNKLLVLRFAKIPLLAQLTRLPKFIS